VKYLWKGNFLVVVGWLFLYAFIPIVYFINIRELPFHIYMCSPALTAIGALFNTKKELFMLLALETVCSISTNAAIVNTTILATLNAALI